MASAPDDSRRGAGPFNVGPGHRKACDLPRRGRPDGTVLGPPPARRVGGCGQGTPCHGWDIVGTRASALDARPPFFRMPDFYRAGTGALGRPPNSGGQFSRIPPGPVFQGRHPSRQGARTAAPQAAEGRSPAGIPAPSPRPACDRLARIREAERREGGPASCDRAPARGPPAARRWGPILNGPFLP